MLRFKFQGKDVDLEMEGLVDVGQLRNSLSSVLSIEPSTCKIIGMKAKDNKQASDDTLLSDLMPQKGASRWMVMGSAREALAGLEAASSSAASEGSVIDDLDMGEDEELLALADQAEVKEKLSKRINTVVIKILNAPREAKKLLVLDIDYTLFDLGGTAERPMDLARPYLHEFLAEAYTQYDLVIWSATSMKWVEVKMRELGVLSSPDFKISFMMDFTSMIPVTVPPHTFDCKPLAVIWGKFPAFYNEKNTIMVDDLRQNFVLNPQSGLRCRAYCKSHLAEVVQGDKELKNIGIYLRLIASLDDLSTLNHREWEQYIRSERKRGRDSTRDARLPE